jgi:ATP-dependent phosphofructokinase / diphosphate-dependent phosphofructokinase
MKIGICTGGGDCPGLNAIIRAAVKHAIGTYGWEIWGIRDSFNGLMSRPYDVKKLDISSVSEILTKGGTILGTTNAGNPFSLKNPKDPGPSDKSMMVVEAYKDLGLDCIIVIGGDGTQGIGFQLSTLGINVVGIPKTIDNDLAATDVTVGFKTAVEIATEAVDRLQSTAESHERAMILEVMGRHAGHLALHAGLGGGAHVILLPEVPFEFSAVFNKLKQRRDLGRKYSVIVVAEGAYEKGGETFFTKSPTGTQVLGGVGEYVAKTITSKLGIETRFTVLGHTQRGGIPCAEDRVLGSAYGVRAIEMVKNKAYGRIACYRKGAFDEITYKDVAGKFRPLDADDPFLQTAEAIGVCLGRNTKWLEKK